MSGALMGAKCSTQLGKHVVGWAGQVGVVDSLRGPYKPRGRVQLTADGR